MVQREYERCSTGMIAWCRSLVVDSVLAEQKTVVGTQTSGLLRSGQYCELCVLLQGPSLNALDPRTREVRSAHVGRIPSPMDSGRPRIRIRKDSVIKTSCDQHRILPSPATQERKHDPGPKGPLWEQLTIADRWRLEGVNGSCVKDIVALVNSTAQLQH